MAEKLSALERAKLSFGDFLPSAEALRQRVKQIEAQDFREAKAAEKRARNASKTAWKEQAAHGDGLDNFGGAEELARAVAERDGIQMPARERAIIRLGDDASEAELQDTIEDIEEEERELESPLPDAGNSLAGAYMYGKQEKLKAKRATEDKIYSLKNKAKDAPKNEEMSKPAKRAKGRPRKHESGSQTSIWFTDEVRQKVQEVAMLRRLSFSDAVNALIKIGLADYGYK